MTWRWPGREGAVAFLSQYKYVLLMIAVGVVLLLLPSGEGEEVAQATAPPSTTVQLEELEGRLSHTLSQISGAGKTTVVLTLADEGRQILAQDMEQEGERVTAEHIVVSDSERGEAVVPLQKITPTFRGALVLCQGAGNSQVKLDILSALSALTGLSSDKIAICVGNQ